MQEKCVYGSPWSLQRGGDFPMRVQAMCERLVAHVCKFMLMRLVNLMKLSTSDYKVFFLRSMAVVLDAFYQTSLHAEIDLLS